MINISDQLHAATEQGIVAAAAEIKDEAINKNQSTINAEQAQTNQTNARDIKKALAWAAAGMVL